MVEGYSPYSNIDASKNTSDHTANDPRTVAKLQDDSRVDDAAKLLSWGNNNLRRFDVTGDNKVNLGEATLGINTSGNDADKKMLAELSEFFTAGGRNPKDGISLKDLQRNLENQQRMALENEQARQRQAMLEAQQAGNRNLMTPMLATADGDPSGSLFRVLDTVRSRKPDDEISKRDLEKFLDEFDRRARTDDVNSGQFTEKNRQYVQNLRDNWDSPQVRQLRGTWLDSDRREHANGSITAKSLREAGGLAPNVDTFAAFVSPDAQPLKQAPVVTAEMARDSIPMKHVKIVQETPRIEDQKAREADLSRMNSAKDLHAWGKGNLNRYDIGGDNKVNYGEVDLGIRTTKEPVSQEKLGEIQNNFGFLNKHGKVGVKDLMRNYDTQTAAFQSNEASRQARFEAEQKQAEAKDLITPLFTTTNGHPNGSLFKVLDGVRGDVDDKVNKKDLKRFVDEYDWRSRHGDVGTGHYTPENRAYVQHLVDHWDSPEVVRLRGTYTVQDNNSGRGSQRTREIANGSISGKSLQTATGVGNTMDLYALYLNQKQ